MNHTNKHVFTNEDVQTKNFLDFLNISVSCVFHRIFHRGLTDSDTNPYEHWSAILTKNGKTEYFLVLRPVTVDPDNFFESELAPISLSYIVRNMELGIDWEDAASGMSYDLKMKLKTLRLIALKFLSKEEIGAILDFRANLT